MVKALEVVGGLSVAYWGYVLVNAVSGRDLKLNMKNPNQKLSFFDRVIFTDIFFKENIYFFFATRA